MENTNGDILCFMENKYWEILFFIKYRIRILWKSQNLPMNYMPRADFSDDHHGISAITIHLS